MSDSFGFINGFNNYIFNRYLLKEEGKEETLEDHITTMHSNRLSAKDIAKYLSLDLSIVRSIEVDYKHSSFVFDGCFYLV